MRNQFLKFISGSIDENGIFGDQFGFLRDRIERIENLMVN